MPSRVELIRASESVYDICAGRKRFGRVFRTSTGWSAIYNFDGAKIVLQGHGNPEAAFRAIVAERNERFARAAGFDSPAALEQRNREVRRANRQRRAAARVAMDRALEGDFEALGDLIESLD